MSFAPKEMPLAAASAFSPAGDVVIVTGAAGNIGRGIAEVFAANGGKVVCSDRAGNPLTEITQRLQKTNPDVVEIPCDLTNPAELKALIDSTVARFGRLDTLINCGAVPVSGPIRDEDVPQFDRLYHTNVRSVWLLTKYAIEPMRNAGGGCIVNIASINAHRPEFFCSLYSGTKAALITMSRELSVELAPDNIRVNTVSPGLIPHFNSRLDWLLNLLAEPYASQIRQEFTPRLDEIGLDSQPVHRIGHAHDIAMACLYLSTPAGRFVTGQDLLVDGGKVNSMYEMEPRFRNKGSQPFWVAMTERLVSFPDSAWTGEIPKWIARARSERAAK